MTRSIVLIWIVAIMASVTMLLGTIPRWRAAHEQASATQARVQDIARHIEALRSLPEADAPASDRLLTTRIASVAARAGLASSAIMNVSPESERVLKALGTSQAVQRRATLTLQAPSLRDLGRFLNLWRAEEPQWVIAAIDLRPQRSDAAHGGDMAVLAVLTMIAHEARERQDAR
ncbi:MAG: hypothetical protein KF757_05575 [Phycisphaeraceae bacterium]|nr:hypothetical protein [Phycisphaeraceae bacterium]MCW5763642.1 hypothetical protein [Phycisphaeraceae bacterium]